MTKTKRTQFYPSKDFEDVELAVFDTVLKEVLKNLHKKKYDVHLIPGGRIERVKGQPYEFAIYYDFDYLKKKKKPYEIQETKLVYIKQ